MQNQIDRIALAHSLIISFEDKEVILLKLRICNTKPKKLLLFRIFDSPYFLKIKINFFEEPFKFHNIVLPSRLFNPPLGVTGDCITIIIQYKIGAQYFKSKYLIWSPFTVLISQFFQSNFWMAIRIRETVKFAQQAFFRSNTHACTHALFSQSVS